MRRKLGEDPEKPELQPRVELEEAGRKFNVVSSAIRTNSHTKRIEQEDIQEITKRLQQNAAVKR